MRGMRGSIADMVRSMVLVLGIVAVIMLVTWRPQPDPVREVDITPVAIIAAMQADFEVLALEPEIAGVATSVRWEATQASDGLPVWHVGYVSPSGEYLQLSQSTSTSRAYLDEQTGGGESVETAPESPALNGVLSDGWQLWESPERKSLVLSRDGSILIVSGTDDWSTVAQAALGLVSVESAGNP